MADDVRRLLSHERGPAEEFCRQRAQYAYLGNNHALCRILGKYLMYVDTRDVELTPHLAMSGAWEWWIAQAVARHVKPSMNVIDVGANVGFFTLLLADLVGEQGSVLAIEPQADVMALLRRTIAVNGFGGCVSVIECAVAERKGSGYMSRIGQAYLGSARLGSECGESQCIVTTLDDLNEGMERRIDFIKIDAEGSEPKIWKGAQRLLTKHKPVVLMEFCQGFYKDEPFWLPEALQGWKVQFVDTDGHVKDTSLEEIQAAPESTMWMLWLTAVVSQ